MTDLAASYADHIREQLRRADHALQRGGCDHLLIASGTERYRFLDDHAFPFDANPHFKAWLPLTHHPHSWISYTPGKKPVLVYHQPTDYWHLPPQDPAGFWTEHFDIRVIREPDAARAELPRDLSRAAIIGESEWRVGDAVPNNPQRVVDSLHLARTRKTAYELSCLRLASLRAARAHRAAATAFRDRLSEFEIHMRYCEASGHSEDELPYHNIVALNEHGATLHYQHYDRQRPKEHRTLLIDAGAQHVGYAADITRTFGNGDAEFTHLLESMNREQLALCARVKPGQDWRELHLDAHRAVARVLQAQGIVAMDPEDQLRTGVSSTFLPHGLGHFLGLQVHDVGGFLKDESGETLPKPEGHPFLRCTRTLEAENVITVEPGLYFIPMLLDKLRAGPHAKVVDWQKIDHLTPFGGIRIEDNVRAVATGEPENLTRDAFRAMAA